MISQWEQFMVESNDIEGECGLNPKDTEVMRWIMNNKLENGDQLMKLHGMLTEHLDVPWSGKYRECDVRVGHHIPPGYLSIPFKMATFWKHYPNMTAFEAHNIYEHIHPFEDFNGRTGRLIWLNKAKDEGYDFNIPFLHAYYYQTLDYWTIMKGKKAWD